MESFKRRQPNVQQIIGVLDNMPELKSRTPKLSSIGSWDQDPDGTYSRLLNVWIPSQPDSKDLMFLFIHLGFNVTAFVYALAGRFDEFCTKVSKKTGGAKQNHE